MAEIVDASAPLVGPMRLEFKIRQEIHTTLFCHSYFVVHGLPIEKPKDIPGPGNGIVGPITGDAQGSACVVAYKLSYKGALVYVSIAGHNMKADGVNKVYVELSGEERVADKGLYDKLMKVKNTHTYDHKELKFTANGTIGEGATTGHFVIDVQQT